MRWIAALALVVVPLAHNPAGVWPYEVAKEAALWTLGGLVALAWAAKPVGFRVGHRGLWLPVVLMGLLVLSTLLGVDRSGSLWGVDPRFDGLLTHLAILGIGLAFLAAPGGTERVQWAAGAVAATAVATIAIWQWQYGYYDAMATGVPGVHINKITAITGPIGSAIFLGSYLILTIPLTLLLLRGRRRWWPAVLLMATLQVGAVVVAGSRGPLVGLAVMAVAGLAWWRWQTLPALAAAGAILVAVYGQPLGSLSTLQQRVTAWSHVPSIFTSTVLPEDRLRPLRPLVGYGPDTFGVAFQRVQPRIQFDVTPIWMTWDRPHNDHLLRFVEGGLLAGLLQIAIYGLAFRLAWARRRERASAIAGIALLGHAVEQAVGILHPSAYLLRYFWLAMLFRPYVTVVTTHRWPILRVAAAALGLWLVVQAAGLVRMERTAILAREADHRGDRLAAATYAERAARFPAARAFLLRHAAAWRFAAGEREVGLALAVAATRSRPLDAIGYLLTAELRYRLGDRERAKHDLLVAVTLWPGRFRPLALPNTP